MFFSRLIMICMTVAGCFCLPLNAQIAYWNFEDASFLDNGRLRWVSAKEQIELVPGFEGKALRTDGYSTYVETVLPEDAKAVSAWFALESFPTDTAAFVSVRNEKGDVFSVCVDRFGQLCGELMTSGRSHFYPLDAKVDKFVWLSLAVSFEQSSPVCYLDGKSLAPVPEPFTLTSSSLLRVGKDFREKKAGIYDVTAINGLIDELKVSSTLNLDELEQVALQPKPQPVLAIPEIRFKQDFNRPAYHLLPAANWTNETHGLFYYQGKYHIFNQKNASSIILSQINWGHFTSPDLIHWTEEKPALTPDREYDKDGIWSGCAIINDKGIPELIYTSGGKPQGVSIAFPKDDSLVVWEKYKKNPVISGQPAGYGRTDLRDPFVWKEGKTWYMIVGYGIDDAENPHGALLLYKSKDAKKWQYVHLLFEGNPEVDHSGIFWEMPFFHKFGDKYVLQVNRVPERGIPARSQYWIGEFKDEKFIPDNALPQNLEVINRLLSPSIWPLNADSVVAMAIIPDEISAKANYRQGWAHVYSLPRIMTLRNGKLVQFPYPLLTSLRKDSFRIEKRSLNASAVCPVPNGGHQVELDITFYPGKANRFGLTLGKNPEGTEATSIYFDVEKEELVVDQRRSSLREGIPLAVRKDAYRLKCPQKVNLHLFIDGSVVEGFIDGEDAFTTRIFPLNRNSTQIELFADGEAEVEATSWKLEEAKVRTNF